MVELYRQDSPNLPTSAYTLNCINFGIVLPEVGDISNALKVWTLQFELEAFGNFLIGIWNSLETFYCSLSVQKYSNASFNV